MADWQPIETAPKDGTKVDLWVIFDNGGHRVADATWSGDEAAGWKLEGFTQHQYATWPDATHWMPLPEPPKYDERQMLGAACGVQLHRLAFGGMATVAAQGAMMGKGTDMARQSAPEHAAVIDTFKEQLLIVAFKRLKANGISLVFPVAEVDDTGQDLLAFSVHTGAFHFDLQRKS